MRLNPLKIGQVAKHKIKESKVNGREYFEHLGNEHSRSSQRKREKNSCTNTTR